jgi:hypothetical protein
LTRLREMRSEDALTLLAIHCKADPTFHPIKQESTRRWHVRTTGGEFEILTTGVKWHVLHLSFVDAVKFLIVGGQRHG